MRKSSAYVGLRCSMRRRRYGDSASRLKQPRIQTIMRALPQLEQRRGLRKIVESQGAGLFENGVGGRRELVLQRLSFHRPDNVQPHGRGEGAAEMIEKEKAERCFTRDLKTTQTGSKDGSKVVERRLPVFSGRH